MPQNNGMLPQTEQPKKNPYAYGLQTEFSDNSTYRQGRNPMGAGQTTYRTGNAGFSSDDRDVKRAQTLANELGFESRRPTGGMDQAAAMAELDMLRSRIGLKNALGESIAKSDSQQANAEENIRDTTKNALSSGLRKTRQNYNSRGLLYSGLREGGEQGIKSTAASQLSSGLAETKRDYGNAKSAAQNAYASVALANSQDTLNRANMAFDTANQNSIARMQAMQQLGQGIGSAAGYVAGTWGGGGTEKPTQPIEGYSMPVVGEYASNPRRSYGLL